MYFVEHCMCFGGHCSYFVGQSKNLKMMSVVVALGSWNLVRNILEARQQPKLPKMLKSV